jgi:hypothetical protein
MKRLPLRSILAIAMLALPACGWFKGKNQDPPKDPPSPSAPELVGRIASIPPEKRFVLIQSYGKWNVSTGTILTTRGAENRSANLLVTGESLGQFAAADLRSGSVEVGDAVYSRHVPKPDEPSESSATPAASSPPLPEIPHSEGLEPP